MVGILILCVILLLLAVLLVPARVRFSYDRGEMGLWLQYGPWKLTLYPGKEAEKSGEEEKPKKKKPKKGKKEKAAKSPKAPVNREQIFYAAGKLPPILGRALRRTRRSIRLGPLKLHLLIAGPDPSDTAVLFGKLEAALGAALPALHRTVRVSEQDIRLFPDFTAERMDCIADIGLGIRPWDVLGIGVRAGGSLVKFYLGWRKLASPVPEKTEKAA